MVLFPKVTKFIFLERIYFFNPFKLSKYPLNSNDNKYASIYGSGFSTFLLILGSVTSSDSEAASEVWSRVIQISIAVIYVVTAVGIMNRIVNVKKEKSI